MTLSLASIHQPLNDFFLSKFKTAPGSTILFRFDKFGSVLSDQDFIDPRQPGGGYSVNLAKERFSELVNNVPVDSGDGLNIMMSTSSISDAYFYSLLNPSIPLTTGSLDETTKEAIINAFSTLKSHCLKVWNDITYASSDGLMLTFKPSLATPTNWYDSSQNGIWTHQSFQISETNSAPPAAPNPNNQLWKLKLDDSLMGQILNEQPLENPPPQLSTNIANRILDISTKIQPVLVQNATLAAKPFQIEKLQSRNLTPLTKVNPLANVSALHQEVLSTEATVSVTPPLLLEVDKVASPNFTLHRAFNDQFVNLNLNQRIQVNNLISVVAPTEPVKTNTISINFDYCVVNIDRPWYLDVFINNTSWGIPNVPKGNLTSTASPNHLNLLPIGFVAIRNLVIEANWDMQDVTNASLATDFGPFKITDGIASNKLSHAGLQIIGWIMQKMPDLPPNDFTV